MSFQLLTQCLAECLHIIDLFLHSAGKYILNILVKKMPSAQNGQHRAFIQLGSCLKYLQLIVSMLFMNRVY